MEQEIQQAQAIYQLVTEFFVTYSFQILGALIIFVLGLLVARKAGDIVLKLCERKEVDVTLSRFAAGAAKLTIIIMVAVIEQACYHCRYRRYHNQPDTADQRSHDFSRYKIEVYDPGKVGCLGCKH